MQKNIITLSWLVWMVVVSIMMSNGAVAAECSADIKTVTTKDVNVPIEVLAYQVRPLTKCELDVEAEAWLLLLKEKVTEISNAQVASIFTTEEIKKAKELEVTLKGVAKEKENTTHDEAIAADKKANEALNAVKEVEQKSVQDASVQKAIKAAKHKIKSEEGSLSAADKTKAEVKTALLNHISTLVAERTILVDRFDVVLNELVAKGGTKDEYAAYIKAISSVKLDVTDTSATWIAVSGWLTSAEGGFRWAGNIIQFIVTMIVAYLLAIVSRRVVRKLFLKSNKFSTLLLEFLQIGAHRLVLLIGFFIGLSALEINIGPVLAIVGAAGFVLAFALQNSLSNFASGILTLIYRPFDIGDLINVAGTLGEVETMNLLSTQLRTPDHQLVIVPNNSVWADVIVNVTGITQRRVDLVFGIGYSDDIDKAQKILEEIVTAHEFVLNDPEPIVKLHELADSSVNFICRPWVEPINYWDVYWDITREVKLRFDMEGVSIPFPQQDVHFYRETVEAIDDK